MKPAMCLVATLALTSALATQPPKVDVIGSITSSIADEVRK